MNTHSTKKSIEEFFEFSLIWEDIQDELSMWLDDIHVQLENNSGELSSRVLDRLGGNAEALRNVLDIEEALKTKDNFISGIPDYVQKSNEGKNEGEGNA